MAKIPAPIGRPTTYDQKYCDLFLNELKKGSTLAQARLALDIPLSTYNRWLEAHEAFRIAIESGLDFSQAAFTHQVEKLFVGQHVNSRLVELKARNCFGWRSKDVDNTTVVNTGSVDDAVKIAVEIAKQKRYADK